MGREVKRLALDFDWPIDKTWEGYCLPEHLWSGTCPSCDGNGYNPETKLLSDLWYTHKNPPGVEGWMHQLTEVEVDALVKADALHDFTHIYHTEDNPSDAMNKATLLERTGLSEEGFDNLSGDGRIQKTDEDVYVMNRGWMRRSDGYVPTPEEVNEWSRAPGIFNSPCQYTCVKARAEHLGFYGMCPTCDGDGTAWRDDAHKIEHDAWKATEPPAGEGWQLWETVSEGSPQSPVFATKEELSQWMQKNGDGNSAPYSKEVADAFVEAGWAPSFIMTGGEIKSGAEIHVEE